MWRRRGEGGFCLVIFEDVCVTVAVLWFLFEILKPKMPATVYNYRILVWGFYWGWVFWFGNQHINCIAYPMPIQRDSLGGFCAFPKQQPPSGQLLGEMLWRFQKLLREVQWKDLLLQRLSLRSILKVPKSGFLGCGEKLPRAFCFQGSFIQKILRG